MIASTDVGPLNEADVRQAEEFGAILICFDVHIPQSVAKLAESSDVIVKHHKLIYKFTDCLTDLCNYARAEGGEDSAIKVTGRALIQ